jgi:hypothetical protein
MRMPAALLLVGSLLGLAAAAQSPETIERPFAPGGRISMDLAAGEYEIAGSEEDRIRVDWTVRDERDRDDVRVKVDVRGSEATISTDRNHDSNFRVRVQVPSRASLHVRLTAGEMDIRGVEGDKDIELHAGELDIDVIRADQYRQVDAGVWAGELHASAFSVRKEGLFRSFDWKGGGPYRLHAHLKAGELRLHAATDR